MSSKKYTTIPVLVEVKKKLEKLRGDLDWSEFLSRLVEENFLLKKIVAARSIQERFSSDVEKSVKESIACMRKLSLVQEQ